MQGKVRRLLVAAAALTMSVAGASAVYAQDAEHSIPVTGSEAFLGAWTVQVDGDAGPTTIRLQLTNQGGRFAAKMEGNSNDVEGRVVERISKSENALTIGYSLSMQGQSIPAALTLTPEGGQMKAKIDVADGMMVLQGEAKKNE